MVSAASASRSTPDALPIVGPVFFYALRGGPFDGTGVLMAIGAAIAAGAAACGRAA